MKIYLRVKVSRLKFKRAICCGTDRRLDRKTKQSSDFDENSIVGQNLYLAKTGIPQKHAEKQTDQHDPYSIFTLQMAWNLNLLLNLLLQVMAPEEFPDQPDTPKASQVFLRELFLYGLNFFAVGNLIFPRYILFHLLSVSSKVFGVRETPSFYYIRRHFCLRKKPHSCIIWDYFSS